MATLEDAALAARQIWSAGDVLEMFMKSTAPRIHEILLFGSLSKPSNEPKDIDLILLVNDGLYHVHEWERIETQKRASVLFRMINLDERNFQPGNGVKIDLVILPFKFLSDKLTQLVLKNMHRDLYFFNSVFATAKRFNRDTNRFDLHALEYLQSRYGTDLSRFNEIPEDYEYPPRLKEST